MSSIASRSKPRVMVDTTVLIAGSGWPRWPREVLLAGLRGECQLVITPYILAQAYRILGQRFPTHLVRFEELLAQAPFERVPDPPPEEIIRHVGLVRDPTDLPIVLAAINTGVDYLVSEDKDLTTQDATTAELRKRLAILLPGTFLREVLGWSSAQLEQLRGRTWQDLEEEAK